MNFNNLNDLVNSIDKEQTTGIKMIRKLLVFKSPVTGNLDYRIAYFTQNFEANIWQSQFDKRYTELNIQHQFYTNFVIMSQK